MIIFLYGEDTYRSKQKLNEIIESYQNKYPKGLNLKFFNLKEKNFQEIKDDLGTASIFGDKKLLIFRESFSNKEFQESFLKGAKFYLDSKDICVFLEEGSPKKDKLLNFLKKNAKSQEFQPLVGQQLRSWVKAEFKKYECQIGEREMEKMINFIGNDLWQFSNEIRKLVSFSQEISEESINLLVNSKIESDIFKTIDAIAMRDRKLALSLIKGHLAKGDNPLYLFSMINFQFRNLLMIKDLIERGKPFSLIPQITQLHPFVVKKGYFLAGKFTLPELKKIYQRIFQADFDIKKGKIKPELGLDLLIASL
ncbi:MAG: DNA polymerase III subunit delta [Patescibacteria group bacterium]